MNIIIRDEIQKFQTNKSRRNQDTSNGAIITHSCDIGRKMLKPINSSKKRKNQKIKFGQI